MSRSVKQDYETVREREQQARLDKVAEVIRDLSFDYDVDTPTVVDVEAVRAALEGTP